MPTAGWQFELESLLLFNLKVISKRNDDARNNAKYLEQQIIKNNEELLKSNPHTSIYKILDAIDEFNNLI